MTTQRKRIIQSVDFIKEKLRIKDRITTAVICYNNSVFVKQLKHIKKLKFSEIPPGIISKGRMTDGEFILAEAGKKKIIFLNGRFNFYNGYEIKDTVHYIYVLKFLGVKNIILIDEVGYLNPRFENGGVALIYDHINLMGTNPLIGENDNALGIRFPDMSNAYDSAFFKKAEDLFIEESFRFFPSVYLGITGPETETEAECRFYREIGSDILGYSLANENIAAVHAGLRCMAIGMITRELVPDKFTETPREVMDQRRYIAEKSFSKVFLKVISLF